MISPQPGESKSSKWGYSLRRSPFPAILATAATGDGLIRGNRDRLDLFALPGVLADHLRFQRRLVQQPVIHCSTAMQVLGVR